MDREYLTEAHQGNLAEIAAGRLAQEKGTSDTVKQLGAKMVEDHTKLDDALQQVAQQLGVDLPSGTGNERAAAAAILDVTPAGQHWDQIWVGTQIASHEDSKDNAEDESAHGTDADVKQLAADAIPVITSHLDELFNAAPQVGLNVQRN